MDPEKLEVDLLLEGIFRQYGYDFRGYARASVVRRIEKVRHSERVSTISALQDRLLHDPQAMARFVQTLSINVTSMFRDSEFYLTFRELVVPVLRTYPFLRIWVAGCSTGEEAYSLAILLHETDLLERTRIYATDFSDDNVQRAQAGMFSLDKMRDYTRNYQRSGGMVDFSKYYTAKYDKAVFKNHLSKNISFAQHNLASDASFNEFHVVLCRNVMIYFDVALQERVMNLIHDSLGPWGFLGLGSHESIFPVTLRDEFKELRHGTRLFQAKN